MASVQFLTHLVAVAARVADPWARLYNDSKAVATATLFLHIAGLMVAGGFAIATDRATLLTLRRSRGRADAASAAERARQLEHVHAVHRPVLAALAVVVASGALLAASDVKTFAGSPVFWVKMALFVALLANGWVMARAEASLRGGAGHDTLWRRLRVTSVVSLALWMIVTLSGTVLTSYA